MHFFRTPKRGFTIIEAVIGIGLFVLFSTGIYSGTQYVFKAVYASRIRITETAILNEQIEIVRNIPFDSVGIVNGSPPGVLARTVTSTRSGAKFTITRTIRSVDDPFDGTVDGTPPSGKSAVCHSGKTLYVGNPAVAAHIAHGDTAGVCGGGGGGGSLAIDTAAGDYKLVDISVICTSCNQQQPVEASTIVAPKFLEGDPTHGALRIDVYEHDYQTVVPDALVHIVATSTNPKYDFYDTTNSKGQLLIPDLVAKSGAYYIRVTKNGYTTDMTTTSVAHPVRPSASVVAQGLQTISFEINPASTINLSTITSACLPLGNAGVHVIGNRLLGTNPNVYVLDKTFTSNSSGAITLTDLHPDDYRFSGSGYDVIGSIPIFPLTVAPGATYSLQLLLGANTTNSLLVYVNDINNNQPIAGATVQVVDNGAYNQTIETNIGHVGQSDWSGGSGQAAYTMTNKYFAGDGGVDISSSPGNVTLQKVGQTYVSSGWLESSTFDLGGSVDFGDIDWQPFVQPSQAGAHAVKYQIATSNSSTPAVWNFVGPNGTAATYYDESTVALGSVHDGKRYLRYRLFLTTANPAYTPTVSDMTINYSTACTPPGQAYFGGLSAKSYAVTITVPGYQTYSSNVSVSGDTLFAAGLTPS